jgi:hypothetical protein
LEVEFVTASSFDFFAANSEKFDLIFLDGDHSAETVYREIPAAMGALNPDGLIMLHDYYPDQRPLWRGSPAIPGPFLAVEALRRHHAGLQAIPLGELPWETKAHSRVTSLAALVRAN